jgi:DNA-binding transcriptional regulator of glucitol operon
VRRLFSLKWCVAHLVLVAAILVMLRLGLWQWHRANSPSGGIQNYAYAFQWPLFALFALVVYVKTLREELHHEPGTPRGQRHEALDPAKSGVTYRGGVRVGVSASSVPVDEDDEEMQAYNARLAALNAATGSPRGQGR